MTRVRELSERLAKDLAGEVEDKPRKSLVRFLHDGREAKVTVYEDSYSVELFLAELDVPVLTLRRSEPMDRAYQAVLGRGRRTGDAAFDAGVHAVTRAPSRAVRALFSGESARRCVLGALAADYGGDAGVGRERGDGPVSGGRPPHGGPGVGPVLSGAPPLVAARGGHGGPHGRQGPVPRVEDRHACDAAHAPRRAGVGMGERVANERALTPGAEMPIF